MGRDDRDRGLIVTAPALADAWGTSSGYMDGIVDPLDPLDGVVRNMTAPEQWGKQARHDAQPVRPAKGPRMARLMLSVPPLVPMISLGSALVRPASGSRAHSTL